MKVICIDEFSVTVQTPRGNKVDRHFEKGEVYDSVPLLQRGKTFLSNKRQCLMIDDAVFYRHFVVKEIVDALMIKQAKHMNQSLDPRTVTGGRQ